MPVILGQHAATNFLKSHGVAHLNLLRNLQDQPATNGVKDLGFCKVNVETMQVTDENNTTTDLGSMQQVHAFVIQNFVLQKATA